MRIYPTVSPARQQTIAKDATVVICLILLAWIAIKIHSEITGLKQLGNGIIQAGTSVQEGFGSAASAVAGVPVIGSQLSHGLSSAGVSTGGSAVAAGHQGNSAIDHAATTIGWLIFLLPGALLLLRYLPSRARQIRQMTAAARVFHDSANEHYRRLIAQRAVFALPYQQLLRHTRDPLKDLDAGHYEPLIAAALEDAGLSNPDQ